MSTVLEHPHTAQQRGTQATTRLREVSGLDDLKLLSFALAEVAADEAKKNSAFLERVRATYKELENLKGSRSSRSQKSTMYDNVDLVPITRDENYRYDPYARLDPYFVCKVYGVQQLRAAMGRFTLAQLKEAIEFVQAKHPGTKPKTKSRKEDIIDYIVTYVQGAE